MKVIQGSIYIADLNPTKGSEQAGKRPVVVISGNTLNTALPVSIICPITSNIKHYYGCVALAKSKANGLSTDSEILTFQVRTVSQERLIKKIGKITTQQLKDAHSGLNKALLF